MNNFVTLLQPLLHYLAKPQRNNFLKNLKVNFKINKNFNFFKFENIIILFINSIMLIFNNSKLKNKCLFIAVKIEMLFNKLKFFAIC